MPKKSPNKFLKINDKVTSLPKPALGQKKSPKPLYGNNYPNGRVLDVDPFKLLKTSLSPIVVPNKLSLCFMVIILVWAY